MGDLLSQDSALVFPLISATQFPGFPASAERLKSSLQGRDCLPGSSLVRVDAKRGLESPRW